MVNKQDLDQKIKDLQKLWKSASFEDRKLIEKRGLLLRMAQKEAEKLQWKMKH